MFQFKQNATGDNFRTDVQAERQIALIKFFVSMLGLLVIFFWFAFRYAPLEQLLTASAGIFVLWMLVNGGIFLFFTTSRWVRAVSLGSTFIDILVVASLDFVVLTHAPFNFINGPLVALYFVVISAAALRHNVIIVVQAGIACALVHIALSTYSFHHHNIPFIFVVENENGTQLQWMFLNNLLISFAMAFFGFIVGHATKELIASENHYLALFDNIPDGILIISPNMRILASNRKFQQMVGKEENQLFNKPLHRFLGKKTSSYSLNLDADSFKDSLFTKLYAREEILPVQVTQIPIDWGGQKCLEVSIRDMSERYGLELKLARAQKVQTVGSLAGSLAHDFNNILAGIFGAVSLSKRSVMKLDNPKDAESLRAYLNTISDCGQTASKILDRLSTFSRSSTVRTKPVDILDVLNETAVIMSNTLGNHIKIVVENTKPLTVKADKTSLAQALLNLCKNAGDAIGTEPGKISIHAESVSSDMIPERLNLEPDVNYIRICVADNGPGMDQETQKKIFDPFFTTKEKGHGTGIGLSMVYNVAFGHGGAVEVDSTIGEGTTFGLYIEAGRDSLVPLE